VSDPLRIVLATANAGKVAEILSIFDESFGDRVLLLPRPADVPDIEEHGDTLEANAIIKAQAIAEATGMPAIADDTGLEVEALGGAPGVHSARYAGPDATPHDNVVKMLAELRAVPAPRPALFRTVALIVWPDGDVLGVEGSVEGEIALAEKGGSGFGYDPIFIPAGSGGRTFAEMGVAEKNAVSHRGRAFRALAVRLAERMGRD
jgi:XTP/dITP diphosphohydrolase